MIFGNTYPGNTSSRRGYLALAAVALAVLAAALIVVAATGSSNAAGKTSAKAHSAFAQQCPDRFPAQRDPSNPLMLPAASASEAAAPRKAAAIMLHRSAR